MRLERSGSNAQIKVSDTGCGIRPDFLPFIFDRFRQADGSCTRSHGGLGLGLAIVRHLVELHGGEVGAHSAGEGCGTTFTVRLPLAATRERMKGRAKGAENLPRHEATGTQLVPMPSLSGVQVLLVEDNEDSLAMLTATLMEYGATVQTASTAAEGLEVLEWYKPDVLVSDLGLPGEDGWSFIGKVRVRGAEGGKQIPAVALTGYVRVEDRMKALAAGFNMFVPKPVETAELVTAIANLAGIG